MPIVLFQQLVNRTFPKHQTDGTTESGSTGLIREYLIISTDHVLKNPLAFTDGIPTIAFFKNWESEVTAYSPGRTLRVHSAWLTSQYLAETRFASIATQEELLIVRFNPALFYQAFRITASSLRRQEIWSLPAALGENGKELLKLTEKEMTLEGKLSMVNVFLNSLEIPPVSTWLLQEALRTIETGKGQITVKQLTEQLKVNYKWLERNFYSRTGLTPKEYIRLQRFKHAYIDLIESGGKVNIFNAAIDNGYYDYSHLLKDIKHFTGTSAVCQKSKQVGKM